MDHDRNIKYNNRGSIKQQFSERENESVAFELKYDKADKCFVWWALHMELFYPRYTAFIIFSPQIKVVCRKKEKKTAL